VFVSSEQYDWYLQGLHYHTAAEEQQLKQLIASATQIIPSMSVPVHT